MGERAPTTTPVQRAIPSLGGPGPRSASFDDVMHEAYVEEQAEGREMMERMKEGALLAADVIPATVGGPIGGAFTAAKFARPLARRYAPKLLPALYGAPGVKNAAVRSAARIPGAVPGAAGAEYGYRRFLNPHDQGADPLSPGGHAVLAGAAEGAMQGLTPAGHAAGKLAIWSLNRLGLQRGAKLLQRAGLPGGFGGEQRVGADEAIELLHRLSAEGRGHGGYISLAQTLENHLIEQVEGGVRLSLMGAPLWIAHRKGEKSLVGEGWHIVQELMKNGPSPKDVTEVLEAVVGGSTQLHRAATRATWNTLDRGLDDVAARRSQPAVGSTWWRPEEAAYQRGRDRVMIDNRRAILEAEKWAKPGRAGDDMRQAQMRLYNNLEEAGPFLTFEDAHLLMTSIREGIGKVEDAVPGKTKSMTKRILYIMDQELEKAGKQIPANVRYETQAAGRGGGQLMLEETPAGPMLTDLFQKAKAMTKEGHEVFNESVLGPAMKLATKEQFETAVVQGAKSPETLRMVKQVIHDPRYASVVTDMGRRQGIPDMKPEDLWDGVRGNWLNEHLIASMPDSRTGVINGATFYNRVVKNRVARASSGELFSEAEQAGIRDFATALAAVQHIPKGGAGTTVMSLMQVGALTAMVSSDVRERTGGWTTPVAFILAPMALSRLFKNPTVVRSFARGISGRVPATGVARWMTQMIREAYAHDIPFEVVMPDGTKHEVDPVERKTGKRTGAFGGVATPMPAAPPGGRRESLQIPIPSP